MRVTQKELSDYFREWRRSAYEDGLIDFDMQQAILVFQRENLPQMVSDLNNLGKSSLSLDPKVSMEIVLRPGADPAKGGFNLFEIRWPGWRKRRKLSCFVGHRFAEEINRCLRTNLRHVLEPLNIQLLWAGMDLTAVGFFDNIIQLIRECDFCIFDNRDAIEKPNVYIEIGIAYALRRPFIVAEYLHNRIGLPSDLGHINRIPYEDYRELTRLLYFKLPRFLESEKLRRPR